MAHQAKPNVMGQSDEHLPQLISLSIEVIRIFGVKILVPS